MAALPSVLSADFSGLFCLAFRPPDGGPPPPYMYLHVYSAGITPWVVLDGVPVRPRPGWGGELLVEMRNAPPFSLQLRCAWSHHEGKTLPTIGRWPAADYFRLGLGLILPALPTNSSWGFTAVVGPTFHYLQTDGPGDRGGLGLALQPEFWFMVGRRVSCALGCSAEGWVTMNGELVGVLAPYLRLGIVF